MTTVTNQLSLQALKVSSAYYIFLGAIESIGSSTSSNDKIFFWKFVRITFPFWSKCINICMHCKLKNMNQPKKVLRWNTKELINTEVIFTPTCWDNALNPKSETLRFPFASSNKFSGCRKCNATNQVLLVYQQRLTQIVSQIYWAKAFYL